MDAADVATKPQATGNAGAISSHSSPGSSPGSNPLKRSPSGKSQLNPNSPVFVPTLSPSPPFIPSLPPQIEEGSFLPPVSGDAVAWQPVPGYQAPSMFARGNGPAPLFTDLDSRLVSIREQVEFYFSNNNLWRDHFLRKQIEANPDGWVSLEVIASFNRVKNLTTDMNLIICALRQSEQLGVSDDGANVRRLAPLPPKNTKAEMRKTLCADGLPADSTIDSLRDTFAKVGAVALVSFANPEHTVGFIEFDKAASVKRAIQMSKEDPASFPGMSLLPKFKYLKQANPQTSPETKPMQQQRVRLRDEKNWRLGASPSSSPKLIPLDQAEEKRPLMDKEERKARREKLYAFEKMEAKGKPPKFQNTKRKSMIIRQRLAKGPDGTRGFAPGRGREVNVSL